MPSRRITAPDALAPNQEINVSPFSSYNSDNVNAITRAVTGEAHKDFVINGLDVTGTPHYYFANPLGEVLEPSPRFNEIFTNLDSWDDDNDNVSIMGSKCLFSIPVGNSSAEAYIKRNNDGSILIGDVGSWFKIDFTLSNISSTEETPTSISIFLGGNSYTYTYPSAGNYSLYLQLIDLTSQAGETNTLKISVVLDDNNPYSCHSVYIDNVVLTRVVTRSGRITPITDPDISPLNIPEALLRPHQEVTVSRGVCIKDEAVITIQGATETIPCSVLTYSDSASWIKANPYTGTEFTGTSYFMVNSVETSVGFDGNGVLVNPSYDDGDGVAARKINGDTRIGSTYMPVVNWAYICVYYSWYKNPNPNKAYIGLARPEDVNDPRFGEDYLVLGLCRMVDAETCDAIFYYPDGFNVRKDWGFIDATRVTYKYLNELLHWDNRPMNASLALDMLASRIFNVKGMLYFPTHQEFLDWRNKNIPCGTGHGPDDFKQWKNGMYWQNGYDHVAYVIETNTMWKSKIKTQIGDPTLPDLINNEQLQIVWEEIAPKRFEINWSTINSGDWPTAGQISAAGWIWSDDGYSSSAGFTPPDTLEEAQDVWPLGYYKCVSSDPDGSYSVVNPFNMMGRGLVPGPIQNNADQQDVTNNMFLRADGQWKPGGAIDLHFEAKGYLTPTDNLVQGMVAHNGLLKGIHVWSDTPITEAGTGLKVDILLTKHISLDGGSTYKYITASIFSDVSENYINVWGRDTSSDYGPEFLRVDGWTSTNWTGDWINGWTHVTGNTTKLTHADNAVIADKYYITYTSTGAVSNFTIAFGGNTSGSLAAGSSGTFTWTASTTGNLEITPGTTFIGKIIITIQKYGYDLSGTAKEYPDGNTITLSDFNTGSDMPDIHT